LAKYDPDSCSWKTAQCSLFGGLEPFSETWPRWGMMRGGVCWELAMPAHLTKGSESGLRPTPVRRDYKDSWNADRGQGSKDDTHLPIRVFRKEKGGDPGSKGSIHNADRGYLDGVVQERTWPTPTASEDHAGTTNGKMQKMLGNHPGVRDDCTTGQLSPDWVEWLMGWPIAWTRLEPIEMDWRDWSQDPADTGEIPRVGKKIANRADRLKAIGNGQVPAVAAMAWNTLAKIAVDLARAWG
jgi:hypothetical protein